MCCLVISLKKKRTALHLLLLWFAGASSSDGHRLAVLVEASSAAVDVGVGGGRHWLLPRSDRLG